MKHFSFALSLLAIVATAADSQQTSSNASAREPEVVASGMADVHTPPTFADVTIAVATSASNAADAASQNAAKMSSTMAALRQAGMAAGDITTQGYSIDQAYDNRGRRSGAFTARNALLVHVNQIERIGAIIDAAVSSGATEISSIQYGSINMDDARRNAMTEAVKRARADAALIAIAAGGTLGRLISITSSAGTPPGYGRLASDIVLTSAMVGQTPTSVAAPRDLTAIASAYGRWEFVPGPSH